MIRATICLALYLTTLLALAHGMAGGGVGPMIAASCLCLAVPAALRRS
jgi:hypothetical protein